MFLAGKCLLPIKSGGFLAKLRFEIPFSNNKHDPWFRVVALIGNVSGARLEVDSDHGPVLVEWSLKWLLVCRAFGLWLDTPCAPRSFFSLLSVSWPWGKCEQIDFEVYLF
jgi:hypothetical protein